MVEEAVAQFERLLHAFDRHSVRIAVEKMRVGFEVLENVLGFKVSKDSVTLASNRLQGIRKMRDNGPPTTADGARVWIGTMIFLQRFVPGLSAMLRRGGRFDAKPRPLGRCRSLRASRW